jgi:hypothetical protein
MPIPYSEREALNSRTVNQWTVPKIMRREEQIWWRVHKRRVGGKLR